MDSMTYKSGRRKFLLTTAPALGLGGCALLGGNSGVPSATLTADQYKELRQYVDLILLVTGTKINPAEKAVIDRLLAEMDKEAATGEVDVAKAIVNSGIEILANMELSKLDDKQLMNVGLAVKGISILVAKFTAANPNYKEASIVLDKIYAAVTAELEKRNQQTPQSVQSVIEI